MRVGIAIDDWKLAIFERQLSGAAIDYTIGKGLTPDTLFLYVETDDPLALEKIVRAANDEAKRSRTIQ